jgi:adenylate cyclase
VDAPQSQLTLEKALARELLVSERLRVTLLTVCLGVLLLLNLVIHFSETNAPESPAQQLSEHLALLLLIGSVAIYFLFVRWRLSRTLKEGRPASRAARYVTALIETSLPTAALLFNAQHVPPLLMHGLAPSYAYFVFIVLATLRLSFLLCAFTRLVAGLEYYALAEFVLIPHLPEAGVDAEAFRVIQLSKAILMVMTGVAAGLVAVQMRRQFFRSVQSLEDQRQLLDLFGKHVSPQVVSHLLQQKVELGGETRHLCVMFLDIRDFTKFAGDRPPEEVVSKLNRLFDFMIDSVNRHDGIINKFLGDGFMAVFGAPVSSGDDSRRAIAAARAILASVERFNQDEPGPPTRVGIGLHCGPAVAGTVGSAHRKEYTIIGDTVNVASRVEQLNKQFDSRLLVSEAVWKEAGDGTEAVCHGVVAIKGKEDGVIVYQLA